jgi:hypothetical protein
MKKILDGGKGKLSVAKVEGDVEGLSTVEQLMEAYKLQNPAKFKLKMEAGEFDAMLAKK